MVDNLYKADINKIKIGSRTGSTTGDVLSEQSDRAEERGEKYKQQARRQRLIAQRMRQLEEDPPNNTLREPRNAKFQKKEGVKKERISNSDVFFLGFVALFFDAIGGIISLLDFLIPPVGEVINAATTFPLATLTLYTLYKKRGIEFKSTKVLVRFWGSLVIGFIPYLAILPEYLLNVILITISTKAEDKLGGSILKK